MGKRRYTKGTKSYKDALKRSRQVAIERNLKSNLKRHAAATLALILGGISCALACVGIAIGLQAISVTKSQQIEGTLRAIEQSKAVSHDIGGTIQTLFVTEGELVREGQIIASFDTQDIRDELHSSREDVAFLLLRAQCLNALKSEDVEFIIDEGLKQIIGKLQQARHMKSQIADCTAELRLRAFDRSLEAQELVVLREVAKFSARRAQTAVLMHERLGQKSAAHRLDTRAEFADLSNLDKVLEFSQAAERDQIEFQKLKTQIGKSKLRFDHDIEKELRTISDRLVYARSELTRMEALLANKFVYASSSGRIQKLRINSLDARVSPGEHFLEIAPLITDFEIVAASSILELTDVDVGQSVKVKLSSELQKPVWVPAKIERILELSKNKRQLMVHIKREDLNKRDLLMGDHSLNGLGENSNVLISVSAQSALRSLKNILFTLVDFRIDPWRSEPKYASA